MLGIFRRLQRSTWGFHDHWDIHFTNIRTLSGSSDAGFFTTIDLFSRSKEVVVERLSMRKIREVLRLKFDASLSVRKIAKSLCIVHSSAGDYLCRFAASGAQMAYQSPMLS